MEPLFDLVVGSVVKKLTDVVGDKLALVAKRDLPLKHAYGSVEILRLIELRLGDLESALRTVQISGNEINIEKIPDLTSQLIFYIDQLNMRFKHFSIKMEVYVSREDRENIESYLGGDPPILDVIQARGSTSTANSIEVVAGMLHATRVARETISRFIRNNYKIEQK
jgi:hypothetical protein